MKKTVSLKKGFTLLEILLVVGIIAILAGIVILAINPSKQLGDTRNAQRRSDVLSITNAVYQYMIDNNGTASTTVTGATAACSLASTNLILSTTTGTGLNLYSDLVGASSTYLNAMPRDPLASTSTGYGISYSATSKRITVCAPLAENGITISITR
ncbi:MAG: prepilin-type N-terminal cleavage/methylation domain-containing protein [bacterium]